MLLHPLLLQHHRVPLSVEAFQQSRDGSSRHGARLDGWVYLQLDEVFGGEFSAGDRTAACGFNVLEDGFPLEDQTCTYADNWVEQGLPGESTVGH